MDLDAELAGSTMPNSREGKRASMAVPTTPITVAITMASSICSVAPSLSPLATALATIGETSSGKNDRIQNTDPNT